MLTRLGVSGYDLSFLFYRPFAGVAQLIERRLAKAKVAGLNPVSRSTCHTTHASLRLRSTTRGGSAPLFVGAAGARWSTSFKPATFGLGLKDISRSKFHLQNLR